MKIQWRKSYQLTAHKLICVTWFSMQERPVVQSALTVTFAHGVTWARVQGAALMGADLQPSTP